MAWRRCLPWVALLAAAGTATACKATPRSLGWEIHFVDSSLAPNARRFEAAIYAGGCTGGAQLYAAELATDGSTTSMPPPDLAPGRYGFAATALDAMCMRFATACVAVDLPASAPVRVDLVASSGGAACAPAECRGGTCMRADAGGSDAGPRDAGVSCASGMADCDRDPANGCEQSLSSLDHCGACDSPCVAPHASESCDTGTCTLTGCDPTFADCDRGAGNGCEVPLGTLTDCGGCNMLCTRANAIESCATGSCRVTGCLPGWGNCDAIDSNGCESDLTRAETCGSCAVACTGATPSCDPAPDLSSAVCVASCSAPSSTLCGTTCADTMLDAHNCGGCDNACTFVNASGTCVAGSCQLGTCDPVWDDCDMSTTNGCETSATALQSCGGCGGTCNLPHAEVWCVEAVCDVTGCEAGFGDCDRMDGNGCEADLRSASSCGSCATQCAGTTPICGFGSDGLRGCVDACSAPASTRCTDRCVDTLRDPMNCGGCGLPCTGGQVCVAGRCG